MDRRRFVTVTTALATVGLAGCTGDGDDGASGATDEPTATRTATDERTASPTAGDTVTSTTDPGTTSPTATKSGTPAFQSVPGTTDSVYVAWAALDADAFLGHLHTTNNHPEEEVRRAAEEIDFDGELERLGAEVVAENLNREELEAALESTRISDEAETFVDVRTARVSVEPTVSGETPTDRAADFNSFLETPKKHLLAVEGGEWTFVG